MITHPGLRIGLDVPVGKWGKKKDNLIFVSPSFGFFNHKRYQTNFFLLPELAFNKQGKKGSNFYAGAGIGYQLSKVPNTYIVGSDDLVHEISASHWYFLANVFVAMEKPIPLKSEGNLKVFLKPQIVFAYPHFPTRLKYFILEFGIKHDVNF